MNKEIEQIEDEIRGHFQSESCETDPDCVRIFAALLYQERECYKLLLDKIVQLKNEKS